MAPLAHSTVAALQVLKSQGTSLMRDKKIQKALELAESAYGNDTVWPGMTLMQHALGVLRILMPFQPDTDAVCACLLQHALRIRKITLFELEEQFGAGVRSLVSSTHLLSHVTMRRSRSSIEDLRLMLLSVSDDIRVLLIVLCDRCFALEHVHEVPTSEARRICRDVLNLFAPVAARLGIHTLKQRLEFLAFPVVYPLDSERIAEQITALHAQHGDFLDNAAQVLCVALREQGIEASAYGREKQAYSIFRKMKTKTLSHVEGLPDLFALRVLVNTEADCYRTLGLLHQLGRPVANRFKDYIAFPKPNGYRSLHTTVSRLPGVPDGVFIEVQVRTFAMHREAEYGIAAHWSYKEGGKAEHMMQRAQLQQMLTAQEVVQVPGEMQRLVDHIFVLTPKGDIVELPEGATALDFAFQIHTQVGLSFRSAKVNGHIVSLNHELENGDIVEVLTHSTPRASPEWLQLLKMASSKSRLRHYLLSIDREGYVQRGKEILNEALRERHLPLLDSDLTILSLYQGTKQSIEERENLLVKIGQRSDRVGSLLQHLDLLREKIRTHVPRTQSASPTQKASAETLEGFRMPLRYAKCCNPLEGNREKIIGYINRSGHVMVHRTRCRMIRHANPERRVEVSWK